MLVPVKPRNIRAPRGNALSARTWMTEAPLRMLMNNLDAEVAENPAELVVYGGIGRAARDWNCYDRIVETLKNLTEEETLLVQSGKPVGVFPTHADAPRVLIANSNLVPHWATWNISTNWIARDWGCSARWPPDRGYTSAARESCRVRTRHSPKWDGATSPAT